MESMSVAQSKQEIRGYESLVSTRPTPENIGNLAARYFTVDETEKAYPLARWAFESDPTNLFLGINLAMILKDLGRHEESADVIYRVYHEHPEDFYARLAYAEALLKAGFWSKAWPIYDNARPTQQGAAQSIAIPLGVREWQDEIIQPGEKLLIINEGGTGDRFTYPRWIHKLTEMGIDWYFYCHEELYSIYARIFPKERLIKEGTDVVMNYWTTAFALPARLNATPNTVPEPLLITPDPEIRKNLVINTPKDGIPTVGICWSAAERFQGDRKIRSLTEGQMMRLVTSTAYRVRWVSLQFGVKAPYPISNLPINSWEETIAIIDQLDGVVTVDTGVMHLAGAMRKPMSVLLSGNSCWKFLKTGEKCVFFPTAKLYRNEGYGFDNAIDKLVADIRKTDVNNGQRRI